MRVSVKVRQGGGREGGRQEGGREGGRREEGREEGNQGGRELRRELTMLLGRDALVLTCPFRPQVIIFERLREESCVRGTRTLVWRT